MAGGRLGSGNDALDEVLGGGLPAQGITIIMGLPGTGKTILAQQYVFHNADPERPVIYFSTLSEPLEKIVRFGQNLDFFATTAVGRSVYYEDLGQAASRDGLRGVAEQIMATLKKRRPGLVVIDDFKALHVFARDDAEYRRFLYQLAERLSAFPAAALWVGVYEASDVRGLPEFAVADAILELRTVRTGRRDMRFLEVRKLRGSGFRSGQHAYRLGHAGVHLFPRLADVPPTSGYPLGKERMPFGVPALDLMLDGGLYPRASTMIAGPAGSGKTILGLHFTFGGLAREEPSVIATLQENPSQLRRMVSAFGWPADDPDVAVMYRSPVDLYIDEWVTDLLHTVERTRARRLLLDSLTDLEAAVQDKTRFREFMYSLTQRLSRQGTSMVMTHEVPDLFGTRALSEFATSHLSDNVIMLNFYLDGGAMKRALSVIKSRASRHDPAVREFSISQEGASVGDVATLASR